MAPRLAGISKTPFWLLIFVAQILPMGGIVATTLLFGDKDDQRLYFLTGGLFVTAVFVTIVCHCVVSLRVSGLAVMMQQDPQVIVGDPVCLLKLSRIPWYGVAEVDQLQLAIVQTYNSYSIDAKHAGRSGGVSHADDVEKVEWQSAVSDDDRGRLSSFNAVSDYLRQQENAAAQVYVAPLLGSSAPRSPTRGPGSTLTDRSRGGSFVTRFFTPRSRVSSAIPMAGSAGSGVVGAPRSVGAGGDGFYSIPNSYDEHSALIEGRSHPGSIHESHLQQRHDPASQFSAVTMYTPVSIVSDANHNTAAPAGGSMKVMESATSSRALFDPLGDNDCTWDVLQKGLKLQSSIFVQLISSLRVGQSLSAVTLPVHILESRSLLEMLTDTFVHWELLLPIARGELTSNVERLSLVFKWFMSAYHVKPKGAKKPYNPILGEVFRCCFPDTTTPSSGSKTTDSLEVLSEQVSHHPPVSAVYGKFKDLIEISIVYAPKSKFVSLNCAASICEGGITVTFPKSGQQYKISFPSAYVSGIIAGTPTLELGGTVTITDLVKNDARAEVEFLRKGWISGTYDQIHCRVIQQGAKAPLKEYSGTWHGKIYDGPPPAGGKLTGREVVFLDPVALGLRRPKAKLLNGPNGNEKISRVIWKELTVALRQGNAEVAAQSKHLVETAQRAERKQLAAEKRIHQTRFFRFVGGKNEHDEAALTKIDNWVFTADALLVESPGAAPS